MKFRVLAIGHGLPSSRKAHWNGKGAWSNPKKREGYFTNSGEPTELIRHSWDYPLPHRGFSRGDGNGWSRLTDGDLKTYWKSNPYLTSAFTGEDDALHPQWVIVDLGSKVDINAIRIAWADPYARLYAVQFWTGEEEPFYDGTTKGTWQTFPAASITDGKGGTVTLKLVSWMVPLRYLRIWMTESSNTCDTHDSADKRNCVGYAINELYVGTLGPEGQFTDVVKHLRTASRPSPGHPRLTHGMPRPIWTNRRATKSDLISSSPAGSPADFPRFCRLRCCIQRRTMLRPRSQISKGGTIRFLTSR